ncbi:MAG: sodium:solute symporter family protein [candidate division KSB1 bacterium]|nr:sodium:solute symporter family protein [candidate division KSB1 bacterium]
MNLILISSIVIIYLFIVGYLAYIGYRRTQNAADYMVAGRSIHPYVMALSYGATFISTSAIVGFGGAAAVYGMGLLYLTFLNIFMGIFVAFVFFGKRTRIMGLNLNAHTFPEFLGLRFQSKSLQGMAGLLIFIGMPLYAAVVLMGGAQFIAQVLQVDYNVALFFFTVIIAVYVVMGGLKGVMYTDAFQGTLMFLGMFFLLVLTYSKLGGLVTANQKLTALAPEAIKLFGAKGHTGWTSFPTFGSEYWWTLVSSLIMGVGIGVLAQPQLVVRFMTVKSNRELNRAVLVGGVFILMMTGVAFVVGALTNVYFYEHPAFGKVSFLAAEKAVDNIIPLFISHAMPQWFTALFMVTLLSAAMSTLSSQFHVMGTAIGRDVYEKWANGKGNTLIINKTGILICILLSLFLAWGLPLFFEGGTAIIARGTTIFFGLCAAAFLPMFVGALYSRKIKRAAALACFWVGFLSSFFWLFFVHTKVSQPLLLCKALFGVDSLAMGSKWAVVDPLFISLPLSTLATFIGQLFGKPMPEAHVRTCFDQIK